MSSSLDFVFSNLISGTYNGSSIAFSPNGEQLLFPQGNRLTLFDVSRGQSITHELEHPGTITFVSVSPCGRYIITADRQNYVFLSEIGVGGFIYQKKFKHPITALAFGPNGFALASANKLTLYKGPAEITPLKPFVSNKRVGGHYDSINTINFSPDGKLFSTCSNDMTIRVFMTSPDDEFVPLTLSGHRGKPLFATFGQDSRTIYSLGADGSFFVWHIDDDFSIQIVSKRRLDEESFENPKNRYQNITSAAFNGDSLIAGFANGSFKTYVIPNDILAIKSGSNVTFSTERVKAVAISDRYAALTSQKLGELVVWDLQGGSVAQRTMAHFGGVSCFDYSPNGVVVATGGDDGKLKIWDTQTGSCLMTFDEHKSPITDVVFGESGRTVITASLDGSCKAFDVVRGRCFRTFLPPSSSLSSLTTSSFVDEEKQVEFTRVAVDSHFDFVAACGRGTTTIFLWSVSTGKLLEELQGHTAPVSSIAFTSQSDGKLVSGSWDGTARVWDFLDSHSSVAYDAHGCEVTDIAVSPDGKTVVLANSNGRLLFYDLQSDNYIGEISGSLDARGGKRFASHSINNSGSSSNNGGGERSSKNDKWYFDSVDFSPDSSYLVCGGRSRFICVYSVKAKLLVRRISHTSNTEFSGVEGYVKEYHGSGVAQQIMDAKLGRREVIEAAANRVRWCPTGRGISAATPEGLIVFVSADQRMVDPLELETDITPDAVEAAIKEGEFVRAVVMAIRLGHTERDLLLSALTHVPVDAIEFVANLIPTRFAADFLQFLAEALRISNQAELVLKWIRATLMHHSHRLLKDPSAIPAAHLLQKALSTRVELAKKTARENLDLMNFICEQPDPPK